LVELRALSGDGEFSQSIQLAKDYFGRLVLGPEVAREQRLAELRRPALIKDRPKPGDRGYKRYMATRALASVFSRRPAAVNPLPARIKEAKAEEKARADWISKNS